MTVLINKKTTTTTKLKDTREMLYNYVNSRGADNHSSTRHMRVEFKLGD
jgi:hypothetical protein